MSGATEIEIGTNGTAVVGGLLQEIREQSIFDWVPIDKMFVDAYARPLKPGRLAALVKNWDIKAVNALVVSLRNDDGRFAVLDGNHRRTAARQVGERELPCLVRIDLTYEQEADLFNKLNTVSNPSALDRFRAQLEANDPAAKEIRAILMLNGLDVATSGPGPGKVQAASALLKIHANYGAAHLTEVIGLLRDGFDDESSGYVTAALEGIAMFWQRFGSVADRVRVVDRLRTAGPEGMSRRAATMRAALSEPAGTAWGRALHAYYNQGLRLRQLPEWQNRVLTEAGRAAYAGVGAKSARTRRERGEDMSATSRRAIEMRRARGEDIGATIKAGIQRSREQAPRTTSS